MGAFTFSVAFISMQKIFTNYMMQRNLYKGIQRWPLQIMAMTAVLSYMNYRIHDKKEADLINLVLRNTANELVRLDKLGKGQFADQEEAVKLAMSRFQAN